MKTAFKPHRTPALSLIQRYRKEIEAGNAPAIETMLLQESAEDRSKLFRELLAVELNCLRDSGTVPDLDRYIARFPDFESVVREQFEGFDSFQMTFDATLARESVSTTEIAGDTTEYVPPNVSSVGLSRFRLIKKIGRGGFGEVWRAFDESTQSYVALKGPRNDRDVTPDQVQQFLAEANRARALQLKGVVKVRDVVHIPNPDRCGSMCYIVMELMEGGSLSDRLGGELNRREAIGWVAAISDTLAKMHRHDLIHRDIKPENILFDSRGRPHLSDFGLAATEAEQLNESPAVVGTVAYMAPEQARGTRVDRRADIYSLGVVLYRILTGNKLPYLARSNHEFLAQLLDTHVSPRAIPDNVPNSLARVCERCISVDPAKRYRTANEIGKELRSWLHRPHQILLSMAGILIVVMIAVVSGKIPSERNRPGSPGGAVGQDVQASEDSGNANSIFPLEPQAPQVKVQVTPIYWTQDGVSTWKVEDSGRRIHVSTSLGLLRLGSIETGQDLSLELEIQQVPWTGVAGVFLGYRQTESGGMRFESIELRNHNGRFEIVRAIRDYDANPLAMNEFQMGRETVPAPDRPRQKLAIDVREGRVQQVRWNDVPVEGLFQYKSHLAFKVSSCAGEIGFCNINSTATYSHLKIDGQAAQMK